MHWIMLAIATYLAAVIETSLSDVLVIGGVAPDLLALVLIVRLLFGPAARHVAASFFVGLAADLATPAHGGVVLGSFLIMGWLVARFSPRAIASAAPWGALTVLLAVSIATLLSASALQILGETELPWPALLLRSLGVGLYTAGFSLPVLMVGNWLCEPAPLLRRA